MIRELAPAKLNLVLHVGRRRADGLHPICSLFASIDLSDELELRPLDGGAADAVDCAGVDGVNRAERALASVRERVGEDRLPPVALTVARSQ